MHVGDSHTHTAFSRDSEAPMLAQVEAALAAGLNYIAFTEHEDYNPGDFTSFFFEHAAYWRELERLRALYHPRITLAGGIEISEPHRYAQPAAEVLERHPWDVVLGSLHWVDGQHNCYLPEWVIPFGGWRPAMHAYFAEMHELAATADFDILAHIDYPSRYLKIPAGDRYDLGEFKDDIMPILRAIVARGKAIEINTNPWRRGGAEPNPPGQVVRWYREAGGVHLTLGTDSHVPKHTGALIAKARALAADCGFTHITHFVGRRATLTELV